MRKPLNFGNVLGIFNYLNDGVHKKNTDDGFVMVDSNPKKYTAASQEALTKLKLVIPTMENGSKKFILAFIQLFKLQLDNVMQLPLQNTQWSYTDIVNGVPAKIVEDGPVERKLKEFAADFKESGFVIIDYNLIITPEFCNNLLNECEYLLNEEGNKEALATLGQVFSDGTYTGAKVDPVALLNTLEKIYKDNFSSVNLRRILEQHNKATTKKSLIEEQEVVVLLGNTGVGKSTTTHFFLGSTFKYVKLTKKIEITRWQKLAGDINVGTGVDSATKDLGVVDLSKLDPAFINYQLDRSVLLCDTPGLDDTGGIEDVVLNVLTIVNPLRGAACVRPLVLISASDFDDARAVRLSEILKNIAKLIRNPHINYQSITYAITGHGEELQLQAIALERIDGLLKTEGRFEQNVLKLLEDMRAKFAKKILWIKPGHDKALTPNNLLTEILTVKPIANPKEAFIPFVEEKHQKTLKLQITQHSQQITRAIEKLTGVVLRNEKCALGDVFRTLNEKLEELQFVHKNLGNYDDQSLFLKAKSAVIELMQQVQRKISELMNPNMIADVLKEEHCKHYIQLQQIKKTLIFTLQSIFEFTDADFSQFLSSDLQRKSVLNPSATSVLATLLEQNELDTFAEQQIARMAEFLQLQNFDCEVRLINEVATLQALPEAIPAAPNKLPEIKILSTDSMIVRRVAATVQHFHVDNPKALLAYCQQKQQQLALRAFPAENFKVLTAAISNLKMLQDTLGTVVRYPLEAKTEFDPSLQEYLSEYLAKLSNKLIVQYGTSLELADFKTAAVMLDRALNVEAIRQHFLNDFKSNEKYLSDLKEQFVAELIECVPPIASESLLANLSADDTKLLIIAMKRLLDLSEQEEVKKRDFKNVKIQDTGMAEMYAKMRDWVFSHRDAMNAAIEKVIVADTIAGIEIIEPYFQQLCYLISIPTKDIKTHKAEFAELQQRLKTFVIKFYSGFAALLKQPHRVADSDYQSMQQYLQALKQPWIVVLDLPKDSSQALKARLIERIEYLTKLADAADLSLNSPAAIQDSLSLIAEMEVMHEYLVDELALEQDAKITCALENFDNRVRISLQQIITDINDSVLTVDNLIQYATYIKACQTEQRYQIDLLPSQDLLKIMLISFTNLKVELVREAFAKLAKAQLAENAENLSEDAAAELVAQINTIFAELETLKQALPDYYQNCDQPEVQCQSLITENIAEFSNQLGKALNAVLAESTTSDHFQKMLQLCKQLSSLDAHLTLKSDGSVVTYDLLHQGYDRTFSGQFQAQFKEVIAAVRRGDYKEACKAADDLPSDTSVRTIVCSQASSFVANMIADMRATLSRITQSKDCAESALKEMMALDSRLEKAKELTTGGLLTAATIESLDLVGASKITAIDAWFDNCLAAIKVAINEFQIFDVITGITQLHATLETLKDRPTNETAKLKEAASMMSLQLDEVSRVFSKPLSEWNNNPFSLSQICNNLQRANKLRWQGNSLTDYWAKIAESVYLSVDAICIDFETQIEDDNFSIKKIAGEMQRISQLTANLTKDEPTQLAQRIIVRCAATMGQLKDQLLTANFADYFHKVTALLAQREALKLYFKEEDALELQRPLQEKVRALREDIVKSCRKNEFPREAVLELLEIFAAAGELQEVIRADYLAASQAINDFDQRLLASLKANVITYRSKGKHSKDQAVQELCSDVQKIQTINLCRQQLTGNHLGYFTGMLSAQHDQNIEELFSQTSQMLTENRDQFLRALQDRDVASIEKSLDFAKKWQEFLDDQVAIIAIYDQRSLPNSMRDLLTLHRNYSYAALLRIVQDTIAKSVKNDSMDVAKFLALVEKNEETRFAHFQKLASTAVFIQKCANLSDHDLGDDLCDGLVASTTEYLQQLYERALYEFPERLEDKESWESFNGLYRELNAFSKACQGTKNLNTITLKKVVDPKLEPANSNYSLNPFKVFSSAYQSLIGANNNADVLAINANDIIVSCFKALVDRCVTEQKQKIEQRFQNPDAFPEMEFRQGVIKFAFALQQIVNTMPSMADYARKILADFLNAIRNKLGVVYLKLLADEFQECDSELGMAIIEDQKIFKGVSIALRNARTRAQGIEYVLENLRERRDMNEINTVHHQELGNLALLHEQFETKYNSVLKTYLSPELDFEKNSAQHLDSLLNELKRILNSNPVLIENGKMTWCDRATSKLPEILAIIFAIWTLRDSKAYFEAGASGDDSDYLKKPHAAQIVAIFRMLNATNIEKGLPNHLVQVLTGEGKSVVLAAVSAILALYGGSVKHSCYSEYLSTRDWQDFESMFKLLGVADHIVYGTYNLHNEDALNQHADIRDQVKNLITGEKIEPRDKGKQEREAERPVFMLGDEIDVFSSVFFSETYNPFLLLDTKPITDLIRMIFARHKQNIALNLASIKTSKEYQACMQQYHLWQPMFECAVKNMLAALGAYRKEDGHEYEIKDGKIAYAYQDGLSTEINKGYRTMWAYFHECDQGNISQAALNEHVGVNIRCGNFMYSSMLYEVAKAQAIIGATGTLEELSPAEREMLLKEFNVHMQTFIPSAYGARKLTFRKKADVQISKQHNYFNALVTEIERRQVGNNNQPIRPVILFFKDKESLLAFRNSKELAHLAANVSIITKNSASSPEERRAEILKATNKGQITLAVREIGRGRDFMCLNQQVVVNGGVHVLSTFFSEQLSEEMQIFGRGARQGQDGSASMVLLDQDLKDSFAVTDQQITEMQDTNTEYDTLHKIRVDQFAKKYEEKLAEIATVKTTLHEPSMRLWHLLRDYNPAADNSELIKLLNEFNLIANANPAAQVQHKRSRTIVLMDATGSMGSLIGGVKAAISSVMSALSATLKDTPGLEFEVQLAVYRNYNAPAFGKGGNPVFDCSKWSSEPNKLQSFIDRIQADYGMGNEAIEVGLCHAFLESEKPEGITQIILIGDMPPNTISEIQHKSRSVETQPYHDRQFYKDFKHSSHYVTLFRQKEIPIHAYYVNHSAGTAFFQMADETRGENGFLDVADRQSAVANLQSLFGRTVIADVAGENTDLRAQLIEKYSQSLNSGKKH